MSLTFIPTVWAARLLSALEKELVYGQTNVSNRDYEGDIRVAGNTVKIASVGDVTVDDYVKDTPIGDPQILTDTAQTMLIDQQKYFHFFVDSVDRAQQNVNTLDEAMRRRSIYFTTKRSKLISMMQIFDQPEPLVSHTGVNGKVLTTLQVRSRAARRSTFPRGFSFRSAGP